MKLQPASEMRKVSNDATAKYEKDALFSDDFKELVKGIEANAEQGDCRFTYIYQGEEPRILGVFSKELKKVGYTVVDKKGVTGFTVNWGE